MKQSLFLFMFSIGALFFSSPKALAITQVENAIVQQPTTLTSIDADQFLHDVKQSVAKSKFLAKVKKWKQAPAGIMDKEPKFFLLVWLGAWALGLIISIVGVVAGIPFIGYLAYLLYVIGIVCFWIWLLKLLEVIKVPKA